MIGKLMKYNKFIYKILIYINYQKKLNFDYQKLTIKEVSTYFTKKFI